MIAAALLLAVQAAPAAAPSPAAQEAAFRKAMAARGLSRAGVDTAVAVRKRHAPRFAQLVRGVATASEATRRAGERRPVNPDAIAAAMTAQQNAVVAVMREQQATFIEQLRASSASDRAVLLKAGTPAPAAGAKPAR